jgi:hypothetical protein
MAVAVQQVKPNQGRGQKKEYEGVGIKKHGVWETG